MKLFIFCAVYNLVIYFCFCDDRETCAERFLDLRESLYSSSEDTLYLLGSNDTLHEKVNNLFIKIVVDRLGAKVTVVDDFCPEDSVKATEITGQYFKNVINLRVTNYYSNNNENLVRAGQADEYDTEVQLCSDRSDTDDINTQPSHRKDTIPLPIDNAYDTSLYNNQIDYNYEDELIGENFDIPISFERARRDILTDILAGRHIYNLSDNDNKAKENTTLCKTIITKVPGVKLVTKSVTKNERLYDIIKHFSSEYEYETEETSKTQKTEQNTEDNIIVMSNIIICSDQHYYFNIDDIMMFHGSTTDTNCKRIEDYYMKNVLAVIAPKPLMREDRTFLPVLFYDTPFLLPEHKDMYPNSIILDNDYNKVLIHALLIFIRDREWNKVTIISDDSPYSDAFEAELTTLLNQKAVLHTVNQCNSRICNITQTLTSLQKDQAKIIIVNVDNIKHAKNLAEYVARNNITLDHGYVWIWRSWPFRSDKHAYIMGPVHSIYVSSDSFRQQMYPPQYYHRDLDEIYAGKILKSLINVKPFITNFNTEKSRRKFYRNIAKNIEREVRSHPQVDVHVRRVAYGESSVIFSVSAPSPDDVESFEILKNTRSDVDSEP